MDLVNIKFVWCAHVLTRKLGHTLFCLSPRTKKLGFLGLNSARLSDHPNLPIFEIISESGYYLLKEGPVMRGSESDNENKERCTSTTSQCGKHFC